MTRSTAQDSNRQLFEQEAVVRIYEGMQGLTPAEAALVAKYLRPGMRILDIGVGGGRTTPALSALASRYVGMDYSARMIEVCRGRFPQLEFLQHDAAQPLPFPDASFDAAVIAFNSIDCIWPEASRFDLLREAARVLARDGVLLFSSHDARGALGVWARGGHSLAGKLYIFLRSAWENARFTARVLTSKPFWTGAGYFRDPGLPGLVVRAATAEKVIAETEECGFEFRERLSCRYPRSVPAFANPWSEFAFRKRG